MFNDYEKAILPMVAATNHCGIDLTLLGKLVFQESSLIDQTGESILSTAAFENSFLDAVAFIKHTADRLYPSEARALWYRINVLDQCLNEYIGIGAVDLHQAWASFVLNYLSTDRAEQGGDTLLVLFDFNFSWAMYFEFSQDHGTLTVQLYQK